MRQIHPNDLSCFNLMEIPFRGKYYEGHLVIRCSLAKLEISSCRIYKDWRSSGSLKEDVGRVFFPKTLEGNRVNGPRTRYACPFPYSTLFFLNPLFSLKTSFVCYILLLWQASFNAVGLDIIISP